MQGLVPQHILDTEPGAVSKVQFCLRTVGADFPLESYSLQSAVREYSTTWVNSPPGMGDDSKLTKQQKMQMQQKEQSRARKVTIHTTLPGYGEITMERWNGAVYSEGVCDAYV